MWIIIGDAHKSVGHCLIPLNPAKKTIPIKTHTQTQKSTKNTYTYILFSRNFVIFLTTRGGNNTIGNNLRSCAYIQDSNSTICTSIKLQTSDRYYLKVLWTDPYWKKWNISYLTKYLTCLLRWKVLLHERLNLFII